MLPIENSSTGAISAVYDLLDALGIEYWRVDHEAAMAAFSAFINDQSLNQKQIAFVHKVIQHIELNGYMENPAELTKPPFDKPISFLKLFDAKTQKELVDTINTVRENAVKVSM